MQQYVNGEGFKGPFEADQKVIDEARKKNEFMAVANPDAKEFEPRDKTPWIKTPLVSFKTPLVVYKKKEQDVTCEYCLAGALPDHQPSVWTKCKDNSGLNNTFEGKEFINATQMDLTPYTDEEFYYLNENQTANMWLETTSSGEEYFTQEFSGASCNNSYWPEEVDQNSYDEYHYNQTTNREKLLKFEAEGREFANFLLQTAYFSVTENQVDNVWLEPSTGYWFNDTLYF